MISFGRLGCAPVYFIGAVIFFVGGGVLISYGYSIIGVIVLIPGLPLLGLTIYNLYILHLLHGDIEGVYLVIDDMDDDEIANYLEGKQHSTRRQKRKKKKRRRRS